MKLLCSRSDTFFSNMHLPPDAADAVELTFAGNPLLTYNHLRAGGAGVSPDGDGSAGTVARYDEANDAWYVKGQSYPFSDIEVLGL